ncbi:glycoside hydrolase, partial [Ceraceosorus guamensis]
GFNIFRYGFSWNILQPDLSKPYNRDYYDAMHSNITNMAKDTNVFVILDLHDFGRHSGQLIGESTDAPTAQSLATLWESIAADFKDLGNVIFGIMNEPEEFANTDTVIAYLQAAVEAIRAAGATKQYILVPSKDWQGISTWLNYSDRTLGISDSENRLIYDTHSYLDPNRNGTIDCEDFSNRRSEWDAVTVKLRNSGKRAFLSELGGIASVKCEKSINDALAYLDENKDVWLGWTAW